MRTILGCLILFYSSPELPLIKNQLTENRNFLQQIKSNSLNDTPSKSTRKYFSSAQELFYWANQEKSSRKLLEQPPFIKLSLISNEQTDNELERGRLLMNVLCISCHSKMLIQNAHKTGEQWNSTLTKMEREGLAELPSSWRQSLNRHLETTQGIQDIRRAPILRPWADSRDANPLW